MSQSKRWCFTINNPSEDDCASVLGLVEKSVYLICGDEVGESGTPHLQGYVVFPTNKRLKSISKLLPRANIQIARGSSDDNRKYCSKGGKFEEYGECPVDTRYSEKRNKDEWSVALELAKCGKIDEIRADLQVRFYRHWLLIADRNRPMPLINNELINLWIHGPTGTGKTKWCWDVFPKHYPKLKNKWWDGYDDEKVVIMHEVGPKHEMLSEHIKEWADHYPFRCEKKGSSLVINCQILIITSNYSPDMIWTDDEILLPLYRRFQVFKFPDEKPSEEKIQEWKSVIHYDE